jgi:mutator protein MutT
MGEVMKKDIHVVGAVIIENDKILCAQRGPSKSLPLKWEFPGGKIEAGESPQEALEREIIDAICRYIFLNHIVVLSRMSILLIVIVSSVWIFYSLTIIDTSEIQVTLKPSI